MSNDIRNKLGKRRPMIGIMSSSNSLQFGLFSSIKRRGYKIFNITAAIYTQITRAKRVFSSESSESIYSGQTP